MSLLNSI